MDQEFSYRNECDPGKPFCQNDFTCSGADEFQANQSERTETEQYSVCGMIYEMHHGFWRCREYLLVMRLVFTTTIYNISNVPKKMIVYNSLLLRLITDCCIKLTKFIINLPYSCGKTNYAIRDQIEIISNTDDFANCFTKLAIQIIASLPQCSIY